MLSFNDMLDMYRVSIAYKKSYITYLNSIDNKNYHQTAKWLNDIIIFSGKPVKSKTPVEDALNKFDNFFATKSYNPNTIGNWRVAYKDLAQVVLGLFYANVWLDYVLKKRPNIKLLELLAACAIFASDKVVGDVKQGRLGTTKNPGNKYASCDNCDHVRNSASSGTSVIVCGRSCHADNNNYANIYIKTAVLKSYWPKLQGYGYRSFTDYEACHIWGNPRCPNYYSSIQNLVLVPRAIAGITDYYLQAQQLLQIHSSILFGNPAQCTINSGCIQNCIVPSMPRIYRAMVWRQIF